PRAPPHTIAASEPMIQSPGPDLAARTLRARSAPFASERSEPGGGSFTRLCRVKEGDGSPSGVHPGAPRVRISRLELPARAARGRAKASGEWGPRRALPDGGEGRRPSRL